MMVTTGSTSSGSVLLCVLVNLVLLHGTRSQKYDNMPVYVSRNGITTTDFDLKLVSSIRELKPYPAKSKTSRYRNVWEMDRSFRTWACKSALTYKDRRPKLAVYNPFEEGSANVVRVDGKYDTIAYTCPTVPAMYLEGRVDVDTNRAQITILKEDDHHRSSSSSPPQSPSHIYRDSPSEERYYEGATFSSSPSTFRHSPPRTSYTSTSPSSSPTTYLGNRYSSSTSPSSLPWSPPPRNRDAAYKPASTSRFRDTVSSKTSTSPHSQPHSRSNSNSGFRYSSIPSPPPAYAQPVKRSFGIGPFIMRLVT